jgi:hypothetical protein
LDNPNEVDIFFTKKGRTTAIENEHNEINFLLNQNYPNPFNPRTTIKYSIPKRTNVKISVYNILGKKIAELVNEEKTAGDYEVNFNAEEFNLTSGVYFYNLITGEKNITRKMIYLK